MAGDWIPIRCDLHRDPAVIGIAAALAVSEREVVGALVIAWSWATEQLRDGHASSVTKVFLDRYIGVTGFCDALASHGWLRVTDDTITFPNWERWLCKGAKVRLQGRDRKRRSRSRKGHASSVTKSGPEDSTVQAESTRQAETKGPRAAPAPPASEAAPLPPALAGVGAPLPGTGSDDSIPTTPDRPNGQSAHREQRGLTVVPPRVCFDLAEQLVAAILRTKPTAKLPAKLDRWADTIRLMQDRDGRSVEQIAAVIAHLPDDPFWRRQILSADNLRKHFDRLDTEQQPALLPRTAAEQTAGSFQRVAQKIATKGHV